MGCIAGPRDDRQVWALAAYGLGQPDRQHGIVHGQHHGRCTLQAEALDDVAAGNVAEDDAVTCGSRFGDIVDVAVDAEVRAAVGLQHVGHDPADPAEAGDQRRSLRGGGIGLQHLRVDPAGQPASRESQKGRERQANGGDQSPKTGLLGSDQRRRRRASEHDQRQLGRACEEKARFDGDAAPIALGTEEKEDEDALDDQDGEDRGQDGQPLSGQFGEVEPHSDRDQEDAECQATQRGGDDLDLRMIVGLCDQEAGEERAHRHAQADCASDQAGDHHHQKAGSEEDLRALGSRRLSEKAGEEQAAEDQ